MTPREPIGRAKVEVAREHVRAVNPWTDLALVEDDVASLRPGSLADFAAACVAVDNHRARHLTTRALLAARVPFVDAGTRADLETARVTVCAPATDGRCLVDAWSDVQLAQAGEDVGVPCDAIDAGEPFASTLHLAQGAAAVAVHQLLALAGVTSERAWVGHELRLDLHRAQLERFRLPVADPCAADHVLAIPPAPLPMAPIATSLGGLMTTCGAGPDTMVVLATTAIVETAICSGCHRTIHPYTADLLPLEPCRACNAPAVALRRTRHVRWGDAVSSAAVLSAGAWFRRGDAFALIDATGPRTFAFAPPALRWERGRAWDAAQDGPRFARLPRGVDLERVRETRVAVLGLGHVGSAILQSLAPLPWRGLLLVDRDAFEVHNLPAHVLAASGAGGAT